MKQFFNYSLKYGLLATGILLLTCCSTQKHSAYQPPVHYELSGITDERIEMNHSFDENPSQAAVKLLDSYKQKVDDIMSPVIGQSTHFMEGKAPESDLSNLIADALRYGSEKYTGHAADFAVFNFGGIRSTLPEGPVTFGNIFEITPFENTLVILEMKGTDVIRLFEQMCEITNGCLSGANIVSKNHKLISAKISGQEIDPEKSYSLATIDYVAEGNDNFTVLKDFTDWNMPEGATLRQCFLDYIATFTDKGEQIDSKIEGRFIIEK